MNLWAGHDSLRVLEDAVSLGKIQRSCLTDRTLRVERIFIQSRHDGAVNQRILQTTLEFERRIDELQLPCLKRSDGTCFVVSPLAFWRHNETTLLDDPAILDTLLSRNASIAGIPITPQMVLAGRGSDESHVSGTNFDYAIYLALTYFFPNSDCIGKTEHLAWLKAIEEASPDASRTGSPQEPTLIALEVCPGPYALCDHSGSCSIITRARVPRDGRLFLRSCTWHTAALSCMFPGQCGAWMQSIRVSASHSPLWLRSL